jgi:protein-tyrosine phosphatase
MLVLTTTLLAVFAQAPAMVDAHRLNLEGAYNFRDLGGYRTTDGKTIKRGMLYRSEALAQLTDRDYEQLASLKIKVLCDFRGDDEKQRAPTKWRGSEIEAFPQPIAAGGNTNSIMGKLIQGAPPSEIKSIMAGLYGQFATTNAPSYQRLLRRMVDGGLPVLYHCTAGKDRTGVFTALLMTILGASKETVMEDYLLTNKYVLTDKAIATMSANLKNYGVTTVPPMESLKPLLGVEPEYLEATFAAIGKEYGNFDEFRRKGLGLSDNDVKRLRSILLD